MDEELYQEQILDHYRNPRHKKELAGASCCAHQNNPLCGDELTVYIDLEKSKSGLLKKGGKVKEITFTGHGCAISQAAASLVIEALQHKTIEEITKLREEKVLELLGIPITASRMKCAMLIYKTLQQAVKRQATKGKEHEQKQTKPKK
ncbi:SUF system NifU family Fe-S cluster assembly protein [Candidatus Woesearchaeota archaeon]|nr:SUF system NifU family Fe-S cluster assembly protein [Candidatus Woesearchaeota archaeon]